MQPPRFGAAAPCRSNRGIHIRREKGVVAPGTGPVRLKVAVQQFILNPKIVVAAFARRSPLPQRKS